MRTGRGLARLQRTQGSCPSDGLGGGGIGFYGWVCGSWRLGLGQDFVVKGWGGTQGLEPDKVPAPAARTAQGVSTCKGDKKLDPRALWGDLGRDGARRVEQVTALLEFPVAVAVGQEPVVADADEALGQDM